MHTIPEPRWERWMIGIGEAMTTVWPAAAFQHRPAGDPRRDPDPTEHAHVHLRSDRSDRPDRSVASAQTSAEPSPNPPMPDLGRAPTGFSHAAVYTSDIDRFRRFYETVVGLRMGVLLQMDGPPYYRHAIFPLGEVATLHVFEMPGYDPQSDGIGTEIGQRGRIDHFGFEVHDRTDLEALRERVTAAGASDGEIRPLGPSWSLHFRDPDGLSVEVNCRRAIPPGELRPESLLEIGDPVWAASIGVHAA